MENLYGQKVTVIVQSVIGDELNKTVCADRISAGASVHHVQLHWANVAQWRNVSVWAG
jgi:hypothetical protein